MASRLAETFAALRADQRAGLVAFVTAGDPDLARSERILLAIDRAGADVIELGVPFSDPIADGPAIQRASERALASGTTIGTAIALCERLRPRLRAPVVLFSYLNPILRAGLHDVATRAAGAGIDGLLVVDLPIEEAGPCHDAATAAGLDQIFLVSPTTSRARVRATAAIGGGFLYAVSTAGVTGARAAIDRGARDVVSLIRAESTLPVAVGFGISTPDQVREVGQYADAAVVGSAIVNLVERAANDADLEEQVGVFVRWLKGAGTPA